MYPWRTITEKNHLCGTRLPFILEVPDRPNTYPDRFCSFRQILHRLLSKRDIELKMYKRITLQTLIRGYETYMFENSVLRTVFRGKRGYNEKMEGHSQNEELYSLCPLLNPTTFNRPRRMRWVVKNRSWRRWEIITKRVSKLPKEIQTNS